jgi:purine-nucleoside phosphorylase
MLISDHLNLAFQLPLTSLRAEFGTQRAYYDPDWLEQGLRIAEEMNLPVSTGVYVWTLGPTYETKAEILFYARAGADAVGMSTVPEVIQAYALGMQVLGISTITNAAAGLHEGILSHDDVLAVGASIQDNVRRFLHRLIEIS